MTSRREALLAARRAVLVERAAQQRMILAEAGSGLLPSGGFAQRLLSMQHLAAGHPRWAVAAAALATLVLFRHRRTALWLGRGWMVWRAWQGLQGWMKGRPAR